MIIFENFDLLIREEAVRPSETLINTLYYQLSHFIKVTNAYVSRIFVTSRNIDLPVLKFIIPYPDKPKLIDFVRFVLVSEVQKNIEYQKCLALLFNNVDQKIHDSLSSLANHIVQVYDILTKEFKTMEAIAKKTLQYVISIRKSTIGQGEATSVNFWMKSVEAIEKVLIRNTKLSYEPIKKIYDMIDSVRGPSDGEIAKIVRQQEAQVRSLQPVFQPTTLTSHHSGVHVYCQLHSSNQRLSHYFKCPY